MEWVITVISGNTLHFVSRGYSNRAKTFDSKFFQYVKYYQIINILVD